MPGKNHQRVQIFTSQVTFLCVLGVLGDLVQLLPVDTDAFVNVCWPPHRAK